MFLWWLWHIAVCAPPPLLPAPPPSFVADCFHLFHIKVKCRIRTSHLWIVLPGPVVMTCICQYYGHEQSKSWSYLVLNKNVWQFLLLNNTGLPFSRIDHFIQKFSQSRFNVIEESVILEPLHLLPLVSKTKVPSCSSHMIVTWSAHQVVQNILPIGT